MQKGILPEFYVSIVFDFAHFDKKPSNFHEKSAPENPERNRVLRYAACLAVIFSIASSVPTISTTAIARQTNTF